MCKVNIIHNKCDGRRWQTGKRERISDVNKRSDHMII